LALGTGVNPFELFGGEVIHWTPPKPRRLPWRRGCFGLWR
jgi:hypothetical protein